MPNIKIANIFSNLPAARKRESFKALHKGRHVKIERIVSMGQATPEGRWLKQGASEWVILLKGKARLCFKGSKKEISLKPGDYVFIPANTLHRVAWTHPKQKTVWLTLIGRI